MVNFRPISCCNVIYKCASKFISIRLKDVLPFDLSQGAFVQGRELLFNVVLFQEVARGSFRKNIYPRCMFEIDLKKAYDSILWDFSFDLLDGLKSPPLLTKWVEECISTSSFTICLNVDSFGYFKGSTGLRQEDPIS